MAITNHERVGKALELLKSGLGPFVQREIASTYKVRAASEMSRFLGEDRLNAKKRMSEWDVAALLKLMWESWDDVFRRILGQAERSLVSELREYRNKWAHQEAFSGDDAHRALDSAGRLLVAVSAPQADEIEKMKMELLRLRFDEQGVVRSARAPAPPSRERRRATSNPGARWSRRTGMWPADATSRPNSPLTFGRCISERARTSTVTRSSSSAAPISPRA
jgi:hypothetical protein